MPKKIDPGVAQISTSKNFMSWGYGTIAIEIRQCHLCGVVKATLVIDPEGSGLSVHPMCQRCLDERFFIFMEDNNV